MAWFLKNTITLLFFLTSFLIGLIPVVTSSNHYVIEALVIVDLAGAKKWMAVTGKTQENDFPLEMNSTFYEISQLLGNLQTYHLDISMQLKDVVLLNNNILSADSTGKVNNQRAASTFKDWIKNNNNHYSYDLALLYTGYDMYSDAFHDSYGYAYIGAVCSAGGVGVVELSGTYHDALATTHEIGHILGSEHDGTKDGLLCGSGSGRIMNPRSKTSSRNHFFFSSCSAYMIQNMFDQLTRDGKNCLLNTDHYLVLTGPRYGSMVTGDQSCQRKYGAHSYVARKAYSSYGDNMCVQLACMTRTEGHHFHWSYLPTPQGINCGKNKQCIQGKCVTTSGGSALTSDSCPFGDQPKIEGTYQTTCSQLAPLRCHDWKNTCCHSCNIADPGLNMTADDVCHKLVGPTSAMARRAYHSYGDNICTKLACLTRVEGSSFHWNYHTAPDGMACGKSKRCSNGRCVFAASGDPNMSDTCPYGDQPWLAGSYQTTCDVITRNNNCHGWETSCCATCNGH